ncbi:lipoprotein [Spiroplasma sp. hyd1]|uniref:lipoprotein n=1 Tax=Spiroplasma sp. hyd1 TaxID=1609976 RepID=UPI0018DC5A0E|nr:lipoprotein [Spiroplasma sp. hyd1]MBH8623354.1 hypothetical protein [Spiroplasma sp. hyd1]
MKKILSFLSIFSLTISGTSNIIACNDSKDLEFTDKELFDFRTKDILSNEYVDVYKNIKDKYPNMNIEIIKEKQKNGRIAWSNNIGLSTTKIEFNGDGGETFGNQ